MIEEFIKTLQQDEHDAEGIIARGQERAEEIRSRTQETILALRRAADQSVAQKIQDITAAQEKVRQEIKLNNDHRLAEEIKALQQSASLHRAATIEFLINQFFGN